MEANVEFVRINIKVSIQQVTDKKLRCQYLATVRVFAILK